MSRLSIEPTIDGVDPAGHQLPVEHVDLMSEDVAEELEPMFETYADVLEMMALLIKACDRFGEAVGARAKAVLEAPYPDV